MSGWGWQRYSQNREQPKHEQESEVWASFSWRNHQHRTARCNSMTYFDFFAGPSLASDVAECFPFNFFPFFPANTGKSFSLFMLPIMLSLSACKDGTGLCLAWPRAGSLESSELAVIEVGSWERFGVLPGPVYANDLSHSINSSLRELSSVEGAGGNRGRSLLDCGDLIGEKCSAAWAASAK